MQRYRNMLNADCRDQYAPIYVTLTEIASISDIGNDAYQRIV